MLHRLALAALLAPAIVLGGCSWTRDIIKSDKVDYKTEGQSAAASGNTLEVPPDLTQPTRTGRYELPTDGGARAKVQTASELAQVKPIQVSTGVLPEIKNARIERGGSQRWLVVAGKPEQYWQPIKEFWLENGFVLATERADVGVMETDWAENRAQIRKDWVGRSLSGVLDGVFSTPFRDKFRTRLELNAAGETEIYISHRGMVEVYRNEAREQTTWQERPVDPEIEAEFLRRVMMRLGEDENRAADIVKRSDPKEAPQQSGLGKDGQYTVVTVNDSFDRAWRRVGLALDRVGFTVEDRDRSKGLYFVRYADPDSVKQKKSEGWLSKVTDIFNTDKTPPAEQYQIKVSSADPNSKVAVLSKTGTPEETQTSRRILTLLNEQLR